MNNIGSKILFGLIIWLFSTQYCLAQSITADAIQQKLKLLEQQQDTENQPTTNIITGYLRDTLSYLSTAETYRKKTEEYKRAISQAPKETLQLKKKLSKVLQKKTVRSYFRKSLEVLEQQILSHRASIRELEKQQLEVENQIEGMVIRPQLIRDSLANVNRRRTEISSQLINIASTSDEKEIVEAYRTALEAEREMLTTELNMLELERFSYDVRDDLLEIKLQLIHAESDANRFELKELQEQAHSKRSRQAIIAKEKTTKAQEQAEDKHNVVRQAAEKNARFSEKLGELTESIENYTHQHRSLGILLHQVERNFLQARQQLEIARSDLSLGDFLRSQRRDLPQVKKYINKNEQTKELIASARLAQFRLDQEIEQASASEKLMLQQLAETENISTAGKTTVKNLFYQLLDDRHKMFTQLGGIYSRYIKLLEDIDLDQQQLIHKTSKFQQLLEENLLWIVSTSPLNWGWFKTVATSPIWSLMVLETDDIFRNLVQQLTTHWFQCLILTLLIFLLIRIRPWLQAQLHRLSQNIGNVRHDSFANTLLALVVTATLALPWPLLLGFIGNALTVDDSDLAEAIGLSLLNGAYYLYVLLSFQSLFVPDGLAASHFDWDPHARQVLSKNLKWLIPVSVPLFSTIFIGEWLLNEDYTGSLGRTAFLLNCIAYTIFAWNVLHPKYGAFGSLTRNDSTDSKWWTCHLWWMLLGICTPILLAVLSIRGYAFSAMHLEFLVIKSIVAILLARILYSMAVRWLLVAERRLALKRTLAKKQADQDSLALKEASEAVGEQTLETPEIITLEAINLQTRRLLGMFLTIGTIIVLGYIWSEITPALKVLDKIVLWEYENLTVGGDRILLVSLTNLILAMVILAITVIAGRNLPGLLEITLLQLFALDVGNRYAIVNISRYLIFGIGFFYSLRLIGIRWVQLQWLVAAMGVGLGFGLKEIFANFMAGLILLFERPIRIGDTVTVGEVSGVISRIRLRSTTILDWDNKEMVIPNQTLIIEPVLNWTLSDQVTRILFNVGIAYGSDTTIAHDLILEVIQAHPLVIEDPNPTVFFTRFGDNALDFEVRVFVKERPNRLLVLHELHMALDKVFRENKIEIAFPQVDLHLRSVDPLAIHNLEALKAHQS